VDYIAGESGLDTCVGFFCTVRVLSVVFHYILQYIRLTGYEKLPVCPFPSAY